MTNRLLLSYLGLALFALVVLEIPLGLSYSRSQTRDLTTKLERDAVSVATLATTVVERRPGLSASTLATFVRRYQRETGGRVVIVRRNGDAVVDSSAGTKVSDNTSAAVSAVTTVIAIGWNIFPSTPVSAKIGM